MIRSITKNEGQVSVFHLRENLEAHRTKAFTKKLYELIDAGRVNLILEMSHVQNISLIGMVAISHLFNRCRQAGGALKVAHLTDTVQEAFEESNLINTIEVYPHVVDALKSLQSENLYYTARFSGSFFVEEKKSFVGWDRLPIGNCIN
ncbi:MAG: anti-sigma factor antagonist [Bradymonadales bacterium]|nr:MAG: anti-sigma factor antagonist [Bradymonadales bacterium]